MMRAVLFALLVLFHDPAKQTSARLLQTTVGSSPGVTSQQEQTARYRVSKVTMAGANAFSADRIISLSRLKVGETVNERTIAKAQDAILRAYTNRGHIKARVGIQPDFTPAVAGAKLGVVEVRIEIDEGGVFVLRRLEFVGNATTRDQIVRRRVLLQEGQPFSQELIEKSVDRLNRLGRFEKVTMSDIEIRVDEKERFVDLLVHLKEIRRRQTRR